MKIFYFSSLKNHIMKKLTLAISLLSIISTSHAIEIPAVHPNLIEENGELVFVDGKRKYSLKPVTTQYTLAQLVGNPKGTKTGITFDFGSIKGTLYYGFIKAGDGRYPQPVFYKNVSAIEKGKATLDLLNNLDGKYDMVNWQVTGQGTLGYRVVKTDGTILYDGKVAFVGKGPFTVNGAAIVEGPLVNFSQAGTFYESLRISFDTLAATTATVTVRENNNQASSQTFDSPITAHHHEIILNNLQPNTTYSYQVITQNSEQIYNENYSFKTAPLPGSRQPFTFAYASDSRHAQGGGERRIEGVNA